MEKPTLHKDQPYDRFVHHVTIDERGQMVERLLLPSTGIPADICRVNNALRPRWGLPLLEAHNWSQKLAEEAVNRMHGL